MILEVGMDGFVADNPGDWAFGMFTVLKVREGITSYEDPGWYRHPGGSVAEPVGGTRSSGEAPDVHLYTCRMHPDVIQDQPGECPKCGMELVPKRP